MNQRRYPLRSREPPKPPSFGHALARLSDEDLLGELEQARGQQNLDAYRRALEAEIERRDIDPRGGRR